MPPDTVSSRTVDFFIVGQPKTGTTALVEMLRQHPQIYIPPLKEPEFFADDLRLTGKRRYSDELPTTLDAYLRLFQPSGREQLRGEASVIYMRSHVAAARIARFNPRARIIAILREPAALLWSSHLQLIQAHIETERDLRVALALEERRRSGDAIPDSSTRPELLLYSELVRYVDQLARFEAHFPPSQLLVLIYDDFVTRPDGVLRRIESFLGVDEFVEIEATRVNPTVLLRSPRGESLLYRLSHGSGHGFRLAKAGIELVTTAELRSRLLQLAYRRVNGRAPRLDQELARELRQRFAPEVARLSKHIGRDLISLWGCA